jgi:hypothetical protein
MSAGVLFHRNRHFLRQAFAGQGDVRPIGGLQAEGVRAGGELQSVSTMI